MKRIVIFSLVFFFCLSGLFSKKVFASGHLVTAKPVPSATPSSSVPNNVNYSNYYDKIKSWIAERSENYVYTAREAELNYFFTVLVNDSYGVSTGTYKYPDGQVVSGSAYPVRASANGVLLNCFNPDYLASYFKIFKLAMNDNSEEAVNICKSFYSGYIGVPNTNSAVAWTSPHYPFGYSFDGFSNYYNALYADFLSINGDSGTSVGYEEEDPNDYVVDVKIPSDELVDFIEQQNTTNTPKGHDLFKQSRRTDKHFWSVKEVYVNSMPLFDDNRKSQFKDLYLVPFFSDDNATQYYSNYQFHLYYVPCEDPNADFSLFLDTYQFNAEMGYVLLPSYSGWIADFTSSMLPYALSLGLFLGKSSSSGGVGIYDLDYYTLEGYTNIEVSGTYNILKLNIPYAVCDYFANDGTKAHIDRNSSNASGALYLRYGDKSDLFLQLDPDLDLGFVCSKSLIKREYNIDTSRIPPNQVINITGDTIYDYSITNPDTGATSTINEYITNNYTYITNEGDNNGGGGSGGGVGGNVTVGGQIGVSGQVGVDINVSVPDININVNQGNGAGENGGDNVGDYIDTSGDVDVGGIIGKLPQLSKGFTDYLRGFFVWLPPEIYALIILILVISVWNVFRSRR